MQIQKNSRGDLLTLVISGMLDNDSASHFRDAIDESIRAGWHRILLDLNAVPYVSSAGIGVLLEARKKLGNLHGFFGIGYLTPQVEQIFHQTRVLSLLKCDPETVTQSATPGTRTLHVTARMTADETAHYELYEQQVQNPFRLELFGDPAAISTGAYTAQDCRTVSFAKDQFGFGLGAIGPDFETTRNRFGEFLAVAGGVAHSSMTHHGLADYLISQADFIPDAQVLYGVRFGGDFSQLIRFEARHPDDPLQLSRLAEQALNVTNTPAAAVVAVAECAGLIGTKLKRSPVEVPSEGGDRFQFPEVRNWLSYSAEQGHRHSLVVVTGLVCRESASAEFPALAPLLRTLNPENSLIGHFHAAVFPYRPLKKRTLELAPLIEDLFTSGHVQDVLHLISDHRSVVGAGESGFLAGGCWVAPIDKKTSMEVIR